MKRFVCPECKLTFSVADRNVEEEVECPECGALGTPHAQESARTNDETALAGTILLLGGGALSAFFLLVSESIVRGAALAGLGVSVGVVGYVLRRRFGKSEPNWDKTEKYCPQCKRVTTVYRQKLDVLFHLALTLATCGAWLVGWGICWLVRNRWRCAGCECVVGRDASAGEAA